MNRLPAYWAVVPAAGVGRRMENDRPKQYLPLLDKTVIEHSIEGLLALASIQAVMVAIDPGDTIWPQLAVSRYPRVETVAGGDERHHSVLKALEALAGRADENDWVLVHDAVRPCVTVDCIQRLIVQLAEHPVGGLLGHPLSDTLKKVNREQQVEETIDRSAMWAAGTPQLFRYGLLIEAMRQQADAGQSPTDEAMAVEKLGLHPQMVAGRRDNIKITVPGDLELAAFILQAQLLQPQVLQSPGVETQALKGGK